jgi:AcrR family transcriptional regulator
VPKLIPRERIKRLVEVATDVFIREGYRRTQMEDVAAALGTGKGTLYGYVQSKAALFDLLVRCADAAEPLPDVSSLPLATPRAGSTVEVVRARLVREVENLELLVALTRPDHHDAATELASILRDLYVRMSRNRRGIKLVDSSARDHPELAEVWFGQGRWAQHAALVAYLEQRIEKGRLRPVPSVPVAARFMLESVAFWAVHRHWDSSPQTVSEEEVQATLVEMTLHGVGMEAR